MVALLDGVVMVCDIAERRNRRKLSDEPAGLTFRRRGFV
jgi:hypothetical protein